MRKILLLLRPENTEEENIEYSRAIRKFGGKVVLVSDDESPTALLPLLRDIDGILLPGGYHVGKLDFFLIKYAVSNQLRLLGICQGMQSMALWQSNDDLIEIGNLSHEKPEGYVHFVLLQESRLRAILGIDKVKVNSHHKQTVRTSHYFSVVAKSNDGLIEAVENSSISFQIGVQWHPERMLSYDKYSERLLNSFINGI